MENTISYFLKADGLDGEVKIPGVPGLAGAVELLFFNTVRSKEHGAGGVPGTSRRQYLHYEGIFEVTPSKSLHEITDHLSRGTVFSQLRVYVVNRVGVAGFGHTVMYSFENSLFVSMRMSKGDNSSDIRFAVAFKFDDMKIGHGLMSDLLTSK
ncbi:MAG: hypothetical protein DWQ47_02415 [Acidobacteria bacterium]|nr:MAG: hypothetical protein DWQ32_05965 [Acidobacteriota bacterium]REK01269.1 MAG: hypothetical protein DWQ38_02400 [Acidobacteriota bacterium]REK14225.1 MAG: hypothetical protein DWQ43_11655 [Acidobacteriota bacterium]REK44940.1 MAG: hypothetical protein DWQ47_02415 [Acidobacteriota bacterium]